MSAQSIKPTHKSIAAYHETLAKYAAHGVGHEGALETALSQLLATTVLCTKTRLHC